MRPGRATPATKPSCALAREQADGLPRRDAHPWGWRGAVPLAAPLGAQAHGLPRRDAHPSGCRALRASCGATRGALSGPAAPGAPGAGPEWGFSGPRSRPGATGKHVDSGRIRPPGARTARPDPPCVRGAKILPDGLRGVPRRGSGQVPPEQAPNPQIGGPGARMQRPGVPRGKLLPCGPMGGLSTICIFHAVRGSGASDPPRFHAFLEMSVSGCLPATPGGPPGPGPPPGARIVEKHGIFGTPVPGKPQKHMVSGNRSPAGTGKRVTFEPAETVGA